jgi:hypothetical protein
MVVVDDGNLLWTCGELSPHVTARTHATLTVCVAAMPQKNSTKSQYQIVNKTCPNHRNVDRLTCGGGGDKQQQQQLHHHHPPHNTGSLPRRSHARSLSLNGGWRVWNYCNPLRCCVVMRSRLMGRTMRQLRLFERLHTHVTIHSRLFQWISHLTSPPALPTRV